MTVERMSSRFIREPPGGRGSERAPTGSGRHDDRRSRDGRQRGSRSRHGARRAGHSRPGALAWRAEAEERDLRRIDDAEDRVGGVVAEVRHGDRRIGHLRAPQRARTRAPDDVDERCHEVGERTLVGIADRRGDEAAMAERDGDADVDRLRRVILAVREEEAIQLREVAERERRGLEEESGEDDAALDRDMGVAVLEPVDARRRRRGLARGSSGGSRAWSATWRRRSRGAWPWRDRGSRAGSSGRVAGAGRGGSGSGSGWRGRGRGADRAGDVVAGDGAVRAGRGDGSEIEIVLARELAGGRRGAHVGGGREGESGHGHGHGHGHGRAGVGGSGTRARTGVSAVTGGRGVRDDGGQDACPPGPASPAGRPGDRPCRSPRSPPR